MAEKIEGIDFIEMPAQQTDPNQVPLEYSPPSVEGIDFEVISSVPLTREEIYEANAMEYDKDLYIRGKKLLGTDPKFYRQAKDDELFEGLSQAGWLSDMWRRGNIMAEIERRGYPKEFIKAYTRLDDTPPQITGVDWMDKGLDAFIDEPLPSIFSILGGIYGGIVGRNPQSAYDMSLKWATFGTMIGQALGQGTQEVFNRAFRPERARPMPELLNDTTRAAVIDGATELAFGKLGRVFSFGKRHASKGALELSEELAKAGKSVLKEDLPIGMASDAVMEGLSKGNARLLAHQTTSNHWLDIIDSAIENSFFGRQNILDLEDMQKIGGHKMGLNMVESLAGDTLDNLPTDAVSATLIDAFTETSTLKRMAQRHLYRQFDKAYGSSVRPDLTAAIDAANQMLGKVDARQAMKGSEFANNVVRDVARLRSFVKDPVTGKMVPNISWQDAAFIRSELGDISRDLDFADTKARAVAGKFYKLVDEAMEKAAKQGDPKMYSTWRNLNSMNKTMERDLNGALFRRMVREQDNSPEAVLKVIFQPGHSTNIKKLKTALLTGKGLTSTQKRANQLAWNQAKKRWVGNVYLDSAGKDGIVDLTAFWRKIEKLQPDMLKEIFSADELSNLKQLGDAGQLIGKKTRGGILERIVGYGQVGMAGGYGAAGKMDRAIATLTFPALWGELVTSKTGVKWITKGFPGSGGKVEVPVGLVIGELLNIKDKRERDLRTIEEYESRIRRSSTFGEPQGGLGGVSEDAKWRNEMATMGY